MRRALLTVIEDDDPFGGEWNLFDIWNIVVTPLESYDEYPMAYMGPWKIRIKMKYRDYAPVDYFGGWMKWYPTSTFDWLWMMIPLTPDEDVKLEASSSFGRITIPHLHFDEHHGIWKTMPHGEQGYQWMIMTGDKPNE